MLYQKHTEEWDGKIPGMRKITDVICTAADILECISIQDIQWATIQDDHLDQLKDYIIKRLAIKKKQISMGAETILNFSLWAGHNRRHTNEGRWIIILLDLQKQALEHLHSNHMGIEKSRLLIHKSTYWINMFMDIENAVKRFHILILCRDNLKGE